jgi:hypothetical protein
MILLEHNVTYQIYQLHFSQKACSAPTEKWQSNRFLTIFRCTIVLTCTQAAEFTVSRKLKIARNSPLQHGVTHIKQKAQSNTASDITFSNDVMKYTTLSVVTQHKIMFPALHVTYVNLQRINTTVAFYRLLLAS